MILAVTFIDDIVTWLAERLSLVSVTMWGIQFVSTITERFILFAVCAIVLAATIWLSSRIRSPRLRPWVPIAVALPLLRGLYVLFPGDNSGDIVLALIILLALAVLPAWLPDGGPTTVAPKLGIRRWLISAIVVPAVAVGLINGWSLKRFAQALHRDGAVRQFASLDLDSIAVDPANHLLYASGHGTNYLLAYNTDNLGQPPRASDVATDYAQSFYFSPANKELYVFNEPRHTLLVLAAKTLDLKKTVPNVQMTSGDSRIVYDRYTDTLFIASEGGYWGVPTDATGYPVAVVSRNSSEPVYTMKDCGGLCIPGLIDINPRKPIAYLVFPKKVVAYNTVNRAIGGTPFQSSSWVDGMAFTPDGSELLVGAPLRASILRFDAESLAPKGSIGTVFGVRTLAVDADRNLLLGASLATNMVDVIDLRTMKSVAKHFVGPWLRAISLDTKAGLAYVSSTEGLFVIDYVAGLPSAQGSPHP